MYFVATLFMRLTGYRILIIDAEPVLQDQVNEKIANFLNRTTYHTQYKNVENRVTFFLRILIKKSAMLLIESSTYLQ